MWKTKQKTWALNVGLQIYLSFEFTCSWPLKTCSFLLKINLKNPISNRGAEG
ncbi:hypothetical protein QWZ13_16735 [Reinekea marina]|uniref:hypothetical protein n=1 Tax=Reinekea marina TaxID=1310421 RepID=UPI0025B4601D|nr:hypothetical protein [Reinekea marina]MDN3650554.1 hypothetical protein [Reinekea marina]